MYTRVRGYLCPLSSRKGVKGARRPLNQLGSCRLTGLSMGLAPLRLMAPGIFEHPVRAGHPEKAEAI